MHQEEPNDGVSLHAGFPNPAGDTTLGSLDLHQLLISHPTSTFLFRIRGNFWDEQGIFDGDIALVDRALDARKSDLVIWWNESQDNFAISSYKNVAAEATVWGVITSVTHQFRKADK